MAKEGVTPTTMLLRHVGSKRAVTGTREVALNQGVLKRGKDD